MKILKTLIEQIRILEEKLLDPEVRHSSADVSGLLADDFMEIGSSGRMYNKRQVIEGLRREENVKFGISDFQARILAEGTILLTYTAKNGKNGQEVRSLRSSIWNLNDKSWQMVFHQGTMIKVKEST